MARDRILRDFRNSLSSSLAISASNVAIWQVADTVSGLNVNYASTAPANTGVRMLSEQEQEGAAAQTIEGPRDLQTSSGYACDVVIRSRISLPSSMSATDAALITARLSTASPQTLLALFMALDGVELGMVQPASTSSLTSGSSSTAAPANSSFAVEGVTVVQSGGSGSTGGVTVTVATGGTSALGTTGTVTVTQTGYTTWHLVLASVGAFFVGLCVFGAGVYVRRRKQVYTARKRRNDRLKQIGSSGNNSSSSTDIFAASSPLNRQASSMSMYAGRKPAVKTAPATKADNKFKVTGTDSEGNALYTLANPLAGSMSAGSTRAASGLGPTAAATVSSRNMFDRRSAEVTTAASNVDKRKGEANAPQAPVVAVAVKADSKMAEQEEELEYLENTVRRATPSPGSFRTAGRMRTSKVSRTRKEYVPQQSRDQIEANMTMSHNPQHVAAATGAKEIKAAPIAVKPPPPPPAVVVTASADGESNSMVVNPLAART